jgi:predicted ATP-dependent endonuclease of OLD family
MKIKFKNLGTIQETELDLRPLTVIIGPNNSNKTYIAYSVYGLFEIIKINKYGFSYNSFKIEKQSAKTFCLNINDQFLDILSRDIQVIGQSFDHKRLNSFFQDSSKKLFAQTFFDINVDRQEIETLLSNLKFPLDVSMTTNTFDCNKIDYNHKSICFVIDSPLEEIWEDDVFYLVIDFINLLKEEIFSSSLFSFPAERNAFVNTYKMLANRRYKLLRDTQRGLLTEQRINRQLELLKEQGDIRYPQPIEYFLDFLSDIELQPNIEINPEEKNDFQKLADLIEQYIQNNHKTLLKPTVLGGREIKISVSDDLEIDLYNASSSIKQLAPILLYLRYRASKGDLIIIDEPEMNLHPESQAKLLEALAILVNLGVKVLLTTHSPYFMSHLNNLVSGDQDHEDRLDKQANFLYLQDKRAFLPMDKVSAYEMRDNQLVSLKDPDYGIRWDTLSDVSGDIQQKHFEIYEAGKEEDDSEE